MPEIEKDLATQVEQREDLGETPTINCPDSIDWDPGSSFHCTVEGMFIIGEPQITVSMENDDGEYTWVTTDNG